MVPLQLSKRRVGHVLHDSSSECIEERGAYTEFLRIRAAARSVDSSPAARGFPLAIVGLSEASPTRSPATPWRRKRDPVCVYHVSVPSSPLRYKGRCNRNRPACPRPTVRTISVAGTGEPAIPTENSWAIGKQERGSASASEWTNDQGYWSVSAESMLHPGMGIASVIMVKTLRNLTATQHLSASYDGVPERTCSATWFDDSYSRACIERSLQCVLW